MFFIGCLVGALIFGIAELLCLWAVLVIIKYFGGDEK